MKFDKNPAGRARSFLVAKIAAICEAKLAVLRQHKGGKT